MPTFSHTPGGNAYPVNASIYDQSEYWRLVALNRDVLDQQTKDDATSAALDQVNDVADQINGRVDTLLGDAGAIRVRGQIPAEVTALSQMNHADYNGIWQANTQAGLTDAPFPITQATLIEVLIGSPANAAKQTITDVSESWWREASLGGSGTVSSWGPWRKYADLADLSNHIGDAITGVEDDFSNRLDSLLGDAGAIRVRGQVPSSISSLNELNHSQYNGIWQVNTQHALTDAPFPITQATLIEVLIGSPANAAKQTITDAGESWWREASDGGSGTVSSWGQWRKYEGPRDHGIITEPVMLADMRNSEHAGTYGARAYNLLDAPESFFANSLVTVVITHSASNIVSQTLKNNQATAERVATGNNTFGPWRIGLTSPDVSSIRVSSNYEETISAGELLIVTKPEVTFDDFSASTVGTSPAGWTKQWTSDGTATVIADPTTASGKALQLTSPDSTRYAMSMDALGTIADAEMLIRWKTDHHAQHLRPVLRGGGTAGSETSYSVYRNNLTGTANLPETTNGSASGSSGSEVISMEADRWMLTRFRVYGSARLAVKTWYSGAPEPEEWLHSRGSSAIQDGWVGIQLPTSPNNPTYTIDWVSVAHDGGKAPMGGI